MNSLIFPTAGVAPGLAADGSSRVAVIGAGISGLSAAWLLREAAQVTLFEADHRPGGHADTQEVAPDGTPVAVDTGFIVYNTLNYPNLTGFFAALGVATRASDMSFGVSVADGWLEYGGGELHQLFAQRRNALRPAFWGMIRDILRFYREAPGLLEAGGEEPLGDWLARRGYGDAFVQHHILPMGAAIWSASVDGMRAFPARHFARFFHNHGLLRVTDRPQWRTVAGGSREYVRRAVAGLDGAVRLSSPVRAVRREALGVRMVLEGGETRHFDHVILACHADQARALLEAPTAAEAEALGAIGCSDNLAILHTDARLMPRRRGVWSAWNYLSNGAADHGAQVSVTYWMNKLQGMQTRRPLLVSLNPLRAPDAAQVLATRRYRHPQFDAAAMRAQARLPSLQGQGGVWFAGAWTGWGFHEDGIASAVRVAALLGVAAPWAEGQAVTARAA
jgi:predicted NAD/FAD-binding protein